MKKTFLSFTVISIMLFSCSQESKDWNKTVEENTIEVYQEFVKNYPDKHLDELDNALWDLLSSYNDERVIIYDNFRLRKQPKLDADLISEMKLNEIVKILEKSDNKQDIDISGYTANAEWYKIELVDGTTGWTYGAGLSATEDYYETCKLYFDILPKGNYIEKIKEKFIICECNLWEETKISDNKKGYENYLTFFENGIYQKDAKLLIEFIETETCYKNGNTIIRLNISGQHISGNVSGTIGDGEFGDAFDFELSGERKGKIITAIQKGVAAGDITETVTEREITFILGENHVVEKWFNEYSKSYLQKNYYITDCK